jgi:Tol biopolymer transport system component
MTPPDENALLQQAISLARSGRKADAQSLLYKILSENPQDEMAWLWLVQTEPDPAQQILILEECLRHNPKSEYAKKGLAGLRAQMGSRPDRPPQKPPIPKDFKPRKPKGPPKRVSGIWKIIFVVMALALAATLVAGGILFFPLLQRNFPALSLPAIHLPISRPPARTATSTGTFTPSKSSATFIASASPTPTVTRTRTITLTSSKTGTPTISPTPTLYLGTPTEGEPTLFYIVGGGCSAAAVPISGGPRLITDTSPENCHSAKISPDTSRISFLAGPYDDYLDTMDIDGGNSKTILKLAKGSDFNRNVWRWEWSPDATQIAVEAPGMAKFDLAYLYLVASDGAGTVKQLKNGGIEENGPDVLHWSPDGKWIFLWDLNQQDSTVYPAAIRTSDSREVILIHFDVFPETPGDTAFSWSPDSAFLAFVYPRKPITDALAAEVPADQSFIVEPGLDKTIRYIPLPAAEEGFDPSFGAVWSPDGSRLLLLNAHSFQLIVIRPDGQIQNRGIRLKNNSGIVQWSPDGQWISIVERERKDDTDAVLEIVRPDGSDFRILADNAAFQPVIWK